MANNKITPNPNGDNSKQILAIINAILAKLDDQEKRIKILEAITSNDTKSSITSD